MSLHKHKGVYLSNGGLRLHPIERRHGDAKVQIWHNQVLKQVNAMSLNKTSKQKILQIPKVEMFKKNVVECGIDDDNYINVDLDKANDIEGLRVKFTRTEGRKKRTVGLQIEKT